MNYISTASLFYILLHLKMNWPTFGLSMLVIGLLNFTSYCASAAINATVVTISTNADTYTGSADVPEIAEESDKNFGSSSEIFTGAYEIVAVNIQADMYLNFDLSPLTSVGCMNSVQMVGTYDSGEYGAVVNDADINGATTTVNYVNPSSWSENVITWVNQNPSFLGDAQSLTWVANGNLRYVYLNASYVMNSYNQFQQVSFQIVAPSASNIYGLYSREGGFPVYLVISYCPSGYLCSEGLCSLSPTPTEASTLAPTTAATSIPSSAVAAQQSSNAGGIAAGVIIALIVVAIAIIAFYFLVYKKRQQQKQSLETPKVETSKGYQLDEYTSLSLNGTTEFGSNSPVPETTLLNTRLEIAMPGFLVLETTQFRQGEKLGGGGFASIYHGELLDPALKKKYETEEIAIKVVNDEPSLTEEQNLQKFKQEISILWSLGTNPNVISLIGYCNEPRCIITKLYKTDLYKFIHTPTIVIPTGLAFSIVCDVVKAMANIHLSGVAHRDLKSPNVLLETINENGKTFIKAIICDFGIARVVSGRVVSKKDFLDLKGMSPRYTAPEVFARMKNDSQPTIEDDFKADAYSFAIIIWELLTRKRPWETCETVEEIERNVMQGKREDIQEIPGDKTRELLIALTKAAWNQDAKQRPFFSTVNDKLKMMSAN